MDKPEALFLADELEAPLGTVIGAELYRRAAAELRRLHAENEALRNVANRGGHIAVAMSRIADLEAQRDVLLIAMKLIQHATSPTPNDGGHHEAAHDISSAAIKAVEGEKNNG